MEDHQIDVNALYNYHYRLTQFEKEYYEIVEYVRKIYSSSNIIWNDSINERIITVFNEVIKKYNIIIDKLDKNICRINKYCEVLEKY